MHHQMYSKCDNSKLKSKSHRWRTATPLMSRPTRTTCPSTGTLTRLTTMTTCETRTTTTIWSSKIGFRAVFKVSHVLICQHTTLHQKPSVHSMFEKPQKYLTPFCFAICFIPFNPQNWSWNICLDWRCGGFISTILIIIQSEEEEKLTLS